jgi:hypothetical protein
VEPRKRDHPTCVYIQLAGLHKITPGDFIDNEASLSDQEAVAHIYRGPMTEDVVVTARGELKMSRHLRTLSCVLGGLQTASVPCMSVAKMSRLLGHTRTCVTRSVTKTLC